MKKHSCYHIYLKDTPKKTQVRIVSDQFSLPAAILTFIWGVYKQLWLFSLTTILIMIIIEKLSLLSSNYELTNACFSVLFFIIVGTHANEIYEKALQIRGYRKVDSFICLNEKEAKLEFLSKNQGLMEKI